MNHCFDGVKSASAEALERATRSRGKATVLDFCMLIENRRREPTIRIACRKLLGISTIGRADDATSKPWVPAAHILDQPPTSDVYARPYTSVLYPQAQRQAGSFHRRASVVDSRDMAAVKTAENEAICPRAVAITVDASTQGWAARVTLGWEGRLRVLLSLRCHDSRQPTPMCSHRR